MAKLDLKKLNRAELLELLLEQTEENRQLKEELLEVRRKLADKILTCDREGSIAAAAIKLNGVFEAAQAACDQYMENLKFYHNADAVSETEEKCRRLIADAEVEAQKYWDDVNKRIDVILEKSPTLRKILTDEGTLKTELNIEYDV